MGDEKRLVVVLLLVTVAILGYLIGGRSSSASAPETMHEASNAATSLTYAAASGWTQASRAPAISDISIAQPLVLAPRGDATQTGLIVGQLLGSESTPLPAKLLEGLREAPATAVVDLVQHPGLPLLPGQRLGLRSTSHALHDSDLRGHDAGGRLLRPGGVPRAACKPVNSSRERCPSRPADRRPKCTPTRT